MSKQKIFLGVFLLTSQILPAQTNDTLHRNVLDEVVVTANKTEQKQSATGKVITVISKEVIEKSAGKTVAQLLNEQAGLVINGAYQNPGSVQTVSMRGAGYGRALILLDGIPIVDPSDINNAFDLNLISTNDIERIEIAKGAQSTLYGSDAIAGVINIITVKKEILKPVNLKATLSGGNLGTLRGSAQLYGNTDKFSYTLRYSKYLTNGFSSAYDSAGTGHFDNDGFNGDAVNATVQYRATENLLFKTFALYSRYKTGLDAGPFQDDKYYNAHNNNVATGAGFQFHKSIVSLTGNYRFSQLNRKYYRDSAFDKTAATYFIDNQYFGKTQFAELYATIQLGSGFSLLQGGDYRWSGMNQNYISASSFGPYTTAFKDTTMSQSSLYSSLIFNSENKKLNVELGGRLNVHSSYGSNYTYTFNPSYNFGNGFRVFGSIATGFKTPGLYQLYSEYGNKDLQPEKSINYELGVQQQYQNFTHR
ncbi:MAG: TonB-dependent receptor, partial [Chitinophagaceae bacterium]|nr:TonB-dependent receptor [Chitinophagaceae bacterium]